MSDNLFAIIINGVIILAWGILFIQDRKKGADAVRIGLKTIIEMLPMLLIIIGFLGIFSSFIGPKEISTYLGDRSGVVGFFFVSIFSSFLQIPGIIAFPIAATLQQSGAAVATVAVFACASTMASIMTLPLEMKFLGKKLPVIRITLTYVVCVAVGLLTGYIYHLLV